MQYKNYHMSIYRWSIEKKQGESLPQMENPRGRRAKLESAPNPKIFGLIGSPSQTLHFLHRY